MGKKDKRMLEFQNELKRQKNLKVSDIESLFHVSESTARRMCAELEDSGCAVRTFGGIQYLPEQYKDTYQSYSFEVLTAQYTSEKQRIGAFAAGLVEPGDTIFLSGGTTVYQFALHLSRLLSEREIPDLNILTNSIANAEILSTSARVILTGGEYRPSRRDTAGLIGEKSISNARFSKSFIGLDGIDISDGLMTWDIETARIDQLTIKRSDQVYLLTDSSKFKKRTFINYEELSPDYTIITDSNLPQEIQDSAHKNGQSLIIV